MANGPAHQRGSWHVIDLERDSLGEGGQGITYRAVRADDNTIKRASKALRELTAMSHDPRNDPDHMRTIVDALGSISGVGALKILHALGDDEEGKKAKARMKIEITTMAKHRHPNLLRLLDHDKENFSWYVTELQTGGTLSNHKARYTGQALKALRDLRGAVAGVAALHAAGAVHRDIKPANIFVNGNDELILGDFGLVFFTDNQNPRLTATLENAGSRDWMPGWALSMRVDEVRPTFDVFGLGKVLYSMVSKREHLRLWYHNIDEFNLEKMFPNDPGMVWINRVLKKAVVEHEEQCQYVTAAALLADIDLALAQLNEAARFKTADKNPCKTCGLGFYQYVGPATFGRLREEGQEAEASAYRCDSCGNIQFFTQRLGEPDKKTAVIDLATAAKPGPIRIEVLGSRWTRAADNGLRWLDFKVVLENNSAIPDTVRRISAFLDDSDEGIEMRSSDGIIRLEAFDRQECMISAAPTFMNKSYSVRLHLETVQGHMLDVTTKANPSSTMGAW